MAHIKIRSISNYWSRDIVHWNWIIFLKFHEMIQIEILIAIWNHFRFLANCWDEWLKSWNIFGKKLQKVLIFLSVLIANDRRISLMVMMTMAIVSKIISLLNDADRLTCSCQLSFFFFLSLFGTVYYPTRFALSISLFKYFRA